MTPRTRSILRKLGLVALLAASIAVLIHLAFSGPPRPIRVYDVVRLNPVWPPDQRQWYYHTSQGSHLMPYAWFIALEQWDSEQLVTDPDHLTRFRLIPDVNTTNNPDRLPLGFAKDMPEATDPPDPFGNPAYVGITCAGCHTEMLTYKGKGLLIDGAPGQLDLNGFLEDIGKAFAAMLLDEQKFDRFAWRVLNNPNGDIADDKSELKAEVVAFMGNELHVVNQQLKADVKSVLDFGPKQTTAGFGRLDALGQGGNTMFAKLNAKNLRVLDGPVNVLPLWNAHLYGFVQSNSSIRQSMARNVIEAMAVNASVVLPNTPLGDYPSTVRMTCSSAMENMAKALKPPQWPENLFGKLDQRKVARGGQLYRKLCAGCHQPRLDGEFSREWTQWPVVGPPNHPPYDPISLKYQKEAGPSYDLPTFSVDVMGTDPNDAVNFAERTVDARALGLSANEPGAKVIYPVIDGMMRTYYKNHNIPTQSQDNIPNSSDTQLLEMSGYRSDYWRAPKGYPARPLAGIWATAPFLHNGSVPNLYELLSPVAERSTTFYTGNLEFDPQRVGFQSGWFYGGFYFDTSVPGNSNAGHEFTDCDRRGRIGPQLTTDDRWALIEFLKSLQHEKPRRAPGPPPEYTCQPPAWFQNRWGGTGNKPQPQGAAWAQPSPAPAP
ncbi:MAG: hypothetical protein JF614_11795 [Acidobacteria bacterium]|nr:hypothetical protein [Acidobacteriota bacterium]